MNPLKPVIVCACLSLSISSVSFADEKLFPTDILDKGEFDLVNIDLRVLYRAFETTIPPKVNIMGFIYFFTPSIENLGINILYPLQISVYLEVIVFAVAVWSKSVRNKYGVVWNYIHCHGICCRAACLIHDRDLING